MCSARDLKGTAMLVMVGELEQQWKPSMLHPKPHRWNQSLWNTTVDWAEQGLPGTGITRSEPNCNSCSTQDHIPESKDWSYRGATVGEVGATLPLAESNFSRDLLSTIFDMQNLQASKDLYLNARSRSINHPDLMRMVRQITTAVTVCS